MDLGKASLRRSGINILSNALHSKHGLAWTDGRGVYLAPVRIVEDRVQRTECIKLGEFDCVQSLHWSSEYPGSVCYLCLVHQTTVTLWKVSGITSDLHLKQVRKINATPIPQGVLWSPTRDILCVLNRDRGSFYFKHCQSKGSYALPPIDSGKISSGCWSPDGKKLLVGIGSIVLIYQWDDIAKSISDYTIVAWKIPGVEGKITTVTALSNTWMVCTVELPLESLCHAANTDMFRGPDAIQLSSAGDCTDHTSRLFNLQQSVSSSQRIAQLVMFEIPYSQKEPRKIVGVPLRTVIAPDLIHYDAGLRRVTVGSNTQPVLQVFQATDTQLWKIQDIRLDLDERPKGLCGFVGRGSCPQAEGVLVMVGRVQPADSAFLPASPRDTLRLALAFHPFRTPDLAVLEKLVTRAGGESVNAVSLESYSGESIFKELQLPSGNTKVHLLRINPLRQDSTCSDLSDQAGSAGGSSPEVTSPSSCPTTPSRRVPLPNGADLELLLPPTLSTGGTSVDRVVVLEGGESDTELDLETVSFDDHQPNFVNTLEKLTNGDGNHLFPASREAVADRGTRYGPTDRLKPPSSTAPWRARKTHGSCSEASASSENVSTAGLEPRMQRRVSLESDPLSARDRISSELPQQVAALETQLSSQTVQITRLHERIDHISRLLEETSLVTANQYQPLSSPELAHVVLDPLEDGEPSLSKTFVLDNSRLQLEPVKQTFGLITVEIILDGEPCVVGANVDGYIPIKFHPGDTIHITGRRATEILTRSAFISSTI